MKKVQPVPEGFHTVTPFLIVDGAEQLIEFMKKAFNAREDGQIHWTPDHRVQHATMRIGDSILMIADAMEDMEAELAMLYLYVDDVDKLYKQALDANAESIQEPKDEFYGDRTSAVKDRWGNKWWIATHIEDMSKDELARRAQEKSQQQGVTR